MRFRLSYLKSSCKPKASEVLTCYLKQLKCPPWTSYFVKYNSIENDQWGMSHFNWAVGTSNYHILRTGCYPFIKYHCTKRKFSDLTGEDRFFRIIKIMNLGMCIQNDRSAVVIRQLLLKDDFFIGIPCLAYGIAATYLIRHKEDVLTPKGKVTIYFLYEEDKGSLY